MHSFAHPEYWISKFRRTLPR